MKTHKTTIRLVIDLFNKGMAKYYDETGGTTKSGFIHYLVNRYLRGK